MNPFTMYQGGGAKQECDTTHCGKKLPWAKIWELSTSQRGVVHDIIITKLIVFDMNCYDD